MPTPENVYVGDAHIERCQRQFAALEKEAAARAAAEQAAAHAAEGEREGEEKQ